MVIFLEPFKNQKKNSPEKKRKYTYRNVWEIDNEWILKTYIDF